MAARTLAAAAVVLYIIFARRRRKRRNRRIWVRDWIRNHPAQGAYHQLLRELQLGGEISYKHFLVTRFIILNRI